MIGDQVSTCYKSWLEGQGPSQPSRHGRKRLEIYETPCLCDGRTTSGREEEPEENKGWEKNQKEGESANLQLEKLWHPAGHREGEGRYFHDLGVALPVFWICKIPQPYCFLVRWHIKLTVTNINWIWMSLLCHYWFIQYICLLSKQFLSGWIALVPRRWSCRYALSCAYLATWISLTPLCVWSDKMDFLQRLSYHCLVWQGQWCLSKRNGIQYIFQCRVYLILKWNVHECFFKNPEYQCSHKNLNSARCVFVILSSRITKTICAHWFIINIRTKNVKRKWTSAMTKTSKNQGFFSRSAERLALVFIARILHLAGGPLGGRWWWSHKVVVILSAWKKMVLFSQQDDLNISIHNDHLPTVHWNIV